MAVHDDDLGIGTLMRRRKTLSLIGCASAGMLFGNPPVQAQDQLTCIATPEQTEGPYFVATKLNRWDIRTDTASGMLRPGVPLVLTFMVSRMNGANCTPLPDMHVELWQCDAHGIYSGVRDPSFDTSGQDFLRGYQSTDAAGIARFKTIYPGWYPGRTVHIHFMIRSESKRARRDVFTSQLYFDEALSDEIFTRAPYKERGPRTTRNKSDGIFRRGGSQLLLQVKEHPQGLAATFHIGLKEATSAR